MPPAGRDPVARAASRDKAVRAGRPHPIAQRVAQLEVDRLLLGNMNIPELLAIERDFYIADMWTDVVEFAMKIAPDHFDPIIDPLRSQLEAAPASAPTQALIALLRSNLAPEDIDTALRAGEARIVADPFVRYLDLIDFDFEFTNPALNAVRAAAQFPDYQWEFDDRTTAPDEGSRCKHFFWLPGRRQRAWWWLTRQSLRTHLVKIHVTVPFTSSPTYTFKQVLTMRRPKARASSVGAMQIITFIVTTGMAILAAFGAEYGSVLPTSVDWGAAVTALLFGFGIDQIRDRRQGSKILNCAAGIGQRGHGCQCSRSGKIKQSRCRAGGTKQGRNANMRDDRNIILVFHTGNRYHRTRNPQYDPNTGDGSAKPGPAERQTESDQKAGEGFGRVTAQHFSDAGVSKNCQCTAARGSGLFR